MSNLDILVLSYIVISYLASIVVAVNIILENRDPAKTMAWLLIFMVLPGIGLVIYGILGRNIRKRKIFKTQKLAIDIKENNLFKNLNSIEELVDLEQEAIKNKELSKLDVSEGLKKKVISLLLNTGKFPFTANNKVEIFIDGNEKFERLIKDIEEAKEHIHLEYFIIKDSEIGRKIKNLLIKKAKEGLSIKILYDDVGCWRFWFHRKFFREMKKEGIEIVPFLPAKFPLMGGKINYRNHRKIVIIDGCIGYTGGINIGDEYMGKNKKFGYWRDTHIRIEGSSVYMLQMVFLTDWYYTTQKSAFEEKYFPNIDYKGNSMIQVVATGPDSDWEAIHYAYFSAICNAKEKVYIETPYFIPDESLLRALKSAALRGVDVRIIFPGIADHKIVHHASYSYFDDILRSGGKVYLYKKGFIHAKVVIIDDKIASTGSANMDLRSFMLNFEINAFMYDEQIVKKITEDFQVDLTNSKEIHLEDFEKRPLIKKWVESVARLFSPIL